MADPDLRERARALIEEVRRMVETALADPARTQERKDFIQFALRLAESSTASLDARLHYQRYDPDGKLVDMEGPPTAEQLQQDLWNLHGHAIAFLELGSIGISPEAQAHIHRMLTTPARVKKAARDEKRKGERRKLHVAIAAAIRKIAEERKTLPEDLLFDGADFVRKYLLGSVNEKLADQQLPSAKVLDIRAAIREMKRGAL
jgi:hypothetical protein